MRSWSRDIHNTTTIKREEQFTQADTGPSSKVEVALYLKQLWSSRKYPPGPFQLPLIGALLKMGNKRHQENFMRFAKQYGNIYTIWIGPSPIVVLSGYQAVKEGLIDHSEEFNNRPGGRFFQSIFKKRGVIFSKGHTWKQQRQFGQVTLRKLGLGKKYIENIIEEEAHRLVEVFAHSKDNLLDPLLPITNGVFNVICSVVLGNQFSLEEETFQKILEAFNFVSGFGGSLFHFLYEIFPTLMEHLSTPHKKVADTVEQGLSLLKEEIRKRKEHQTQHEPQDFTDFYLLQMEKSKTDLSSTYSEDNLAQCILDFLVAGTETTATTLQWSLLLMATHPDIQDKVYKEIEDVLGTSQLICYQDRHRLNYTNAVIHEVLRAKYVLPVGIPRRCTKDVCMHGYTIPKGTFIVTDLSSVLRDPKYWERPEEFNPHHFLNKDGNFVSREEFLPFGAGSRSCLGEQLARMELFLFFTHLLRAFRFQFPEGPIKVTKQSAVGITFQPKPYKICAIPRYG